MQLKVGFLCSESSLSWGALSAPVYLWRLVLKVSTTTITWFMKGRWRTYTDHHSRWPREDGNSRCGSVKWSIARKIWLLETSHSAQCWAHRCDWGRAFMASLCGVGFYCEDLGFFNCLSELNSVVTPLRCHFSSSLRSISCLFRDALPWHFWKFL